MGEPIKIVVTAQTAQAAADLQAFAARAGAGLSAEVNRASAAAAGNLRSANMMWIGMAQGMSAQMIAGMNPIQVMAVQVPAVVQALNMMGMAFKSMLPYALAVGAAAGVLTLEWKLFMAGTEDSTKRIEEMVAALDKVPGILERIAALQKAGVMSPAAAAQYADYLSGKKKLYVNAAGEVTPQSTSEVEEIRSGPGGATFATGRMATVSNKEATQAQVNDWVSKQPAFTTVAQAQADAKNKLDELLGKSSVEMLAGVDKDIEGIRQRYQKLRDDLSLTLKQAGGLVGKNEQAEVNARLAALNQAEARQIAEARARAQNEQVKLAESERKEIVLRQERELNAALEAYALATTEKTRGYWDTVYEAKAAAARRAYDVDEDELALEKKLADAAREHAAALKQVNEEIQRKQLLAAENKMRALENEGLRISGDPAKTDQEKAREMIPLVQAQLDAAAGDLGGLQDQLQANTDLSREEELREQINDKMRETIQLEQKLKELQGSAGWHGTYTRNLLALKNQWGDVATTLTTGAFSMVQQGVQGMASALTNLIAGTQSVGAAFAQMGMALLQSFISTILGALMMAYVAIPVLTALGVLTGGATASSGATVTIAAVSGAVSAIGGVMAAEGGLIRGPGTGTSDSIPALLSNGEYVLRADAVQRYGTGFLDSLNDEKMSFRGGSPAADAAGAAGTKVVNVFDRDWLRRELARNDYSSVIINHVLSNKGRMGFPT